MQSVVINCHFYPFNPCLNLNLHTDHASFLRSLLPSADGQLLLLGQGRKGAGSPISKCKQSCRSILMSFLRVVEDSSGIPAVETSTSLVQQISTELNSKPVIPTFILPITYGNSDSNKLHSFGLYWQLPIMSVSTSLLQKWAACSYHLQKGNIQL